MEKPEIVICQLFKASTPSIPKCRCELWIGMPTLKTAICLGSSLSISVGGAPQLRESN